VIALVAIHFHWSMFDAMVLAFGLFLPPTVLPVVAGLMNGQVSAGGAVAGFLSGTSIGIFFVIYRFVSAPSKAGNIQSEGLLLATLTTAIVLVFAGRLFPSTGEAADRSNRFLTKLGRTAPPAEAAESPAPIAGLVIAVIGFVLAVIGLGALTRFNWLTIGTGAGLLAIGLAMNLPESIQRRSHLR
jgi:hypothetical protein